MPECFPVPFAAFFEILHSSRLVLYLVDADRKRGRGVFCESWRPKVVLDMHMREVYLVDHFQRGSGYLVLSATSP